MSVTVECQLILEAVDSDLPPAEAPDPRSFPNRVIATVPGELAPLVRLTSIPYTIASHDRADYQALASGLVASGLGDSWRLDSTFYVSGSQEIVSGEWQPASGYAYRFLKGSRFYERDLSGVSDKCVCRYLLSVRFVSERP